MEVNKSLINYSLITHNGKNRIGVHFNYNSTLNDKMRKVDGAAWSRSLKCWHICDTPENRRKYKLPQQKLSAVLLQPSIQTNKSALLYLSLNNKAQMQKFIDQIQLKAY